MSKTKIREVIEKLQKENDILSSEIKARRKNLERAMLDTVETEIITYLESRVKHNVESINALMEVIKNG